MKFNLEIPEDAWEETGPAEDRRARLYVSPSRLTIAGCAMHLEAIAVRVDEQSCPSLVFDAPDEAEFSCQPAIDAIYDLRDADAPDSIEIRGREYVLVAYPAG